ncbi:MAG: ASKHA domain-containing protein [Spirochaetota bacterium]
MSERLSLVHEGTSTEIPAETGTSLLDALIAAGENLVSATCAGKGRCGKCRLRASGALSEPSERERSLLSAAELAGGWRLSCMTHIEGPARIDRPASTVASILAEGPAIDFSPDPPARWLRLALPPPTLEEQISDEERLVAALAALPPALAAPAPGAGVAGAGSAARVTTAALRGLAGAARHDSVEALVRMVPGGGAEVLAVAALPKESGAVRRSLGIGVDIGTTTVVSYLIDLSSGAILGTKSGLNDQRVFGADVIARIQATIERETGLEEQRLRIVSQLTIMAHALLAEAQAKSEELVSMAIAGNTTMLHLFAGVPPGAISTAPFPPVFTGLHVGLAPEFGLDLPATTSVFLLPGLSGYVGADIVSGITALGMAEDPRCSLLLDIGTNGELALGDSGGILSCATAAGPAFEGAGISMGMGGVVGAIDFVWIEGRGIACSTIGNVKAQGLCGSGVLDALACFVELGLIDSSGRILDAEEAAALGPELAALRQEDETEVRLCICEGVWLSQGDVRQLQLATAAIGAGIEILIKRSGKSVGEVERVFLAGGFGSFMDVRSAVRVGLIPRGLEDRVVVAGNSSGAGAVAACLSRARLSACNQARARSSYIELSSSPEFSDLFVEHLFFPEPA